MSMVLAYRTPVVALATFRAVSPLVGALVVAGLLLAGGLPTPAAIAVGLVAALLVLAPSRWIRLIGGALLALGPWLFVPVSLTFATPGAFVVFEACTFTSACSRRRGRVEGGPTSPSERRNELLTKDKIR
jgi:hypothetical protein